MGNLMSTLYIGYVKEIIRDTMGVPTFDLRFQNHGFRVSDETKPQLRPLVIPGMTIMQEDQAFIMTQDKETFLSQVIKPNLSWRYWS